MNIDVAAVAPLLLLGLLMPKAIPALRKLFESAAERNSLISTAGHALSCALLYNALGAGRD